MENASYFRTRARAALGGRIFGNIWLMALLAIFIQTAITGALTWSGVGTLLVAGPLEFGVTLIMLGLARGKGSVDIADIFAGFRDDFGGTLVLWLLRGVFVTLWSMLLFIPGIIKAYSYSMIFYVKADNPSYDWHTCFNESKRIMTGNKWRLFCLDFSFIGWAIVGSLCFGIGTLWVATYVSAAHAAFYESVK